MFRKLLVGELRTFDRFAFYQFMRIEVGCNRRSLWLLCKPDFQCRTVQFNVRFSDVLESYCVFSKAFIRCYIRPLQFTDNRGSFLSLVSPSPYTASAPTDLLCQAPQFRRPTLRIRDKPILSSRWQFSFAGDFNITIREGFPVNLEQEYVLLSPKSSSPSDLKTRGKTPVRTVTLSAK